MHLISIRPMNLRLPNDSPVISFRKYHAWIPLNNTSSTSKTPSTPPHLLYCSWRRNPTSLIPIRMRGKQNPLWVCNCKYEYCKDGHKHGSLLSTTAYSIDGQSALILFTLINKWSPLESDPIVFGVGCNPIHRIWIGTFESKTT